MTLDIQFRLKNNSNYLKYIREHSYWYKILNRDPALFKHFEEEVKKNYKLTAADKLQRIADATEMLSSIVTMFK